MTFVEDYGNSGAPSYNEYAIFDYMLDGVSGSKPISRETFAWPVTTCNGD